MSVQNSNRFCVRNPAKVHPAWQRNTKYVRQSLVSAAIDECTSRTGTRDTQYRKLNAGICGMGRGQVTSFVSIISIETITAFLAFQFLTRGAARATLFLQLTLLQKLGSQRATSIT